MKTPYHILILLISIIITPVVYSAGSPISAKKAKATFTCAIWDRVELEPLFFKYKGSYHKLALRRGTRSLPMPLEKTEYFTLYREVEVDGEIVHRPYAQTKMPECGDRALFLLFPKAKGGGTSLRVLGVDDSLGSFPAGSYKFFNLTKTPIKTLINGKKSSVPSGLIKVVDANIPQKGGLLPFVIGVNNKVVFETRLFSQPKERKMVFVFPNTSNRTSRPVELRFLSQFISPQDTQLSAR